MVESESLDQATEIVKKLTSPEEDIVKFVENIEKVKNAMIAESIEDLIKVRSEAAPVHACQIGDLKPAACPSGSQHLEAFKRKVAAAGEEREKIFRGARDTLTNQENAANMIDADEVASTDKNHLSSQLDKLDKARKLCAAVAGSVDEVQPQDDVLESEQVSVQQLSQAARDEKYQEVTAQRIKSYFDVMSEVAKALTGSGLPMKLNEILDVPNQCDGLSRIGAQLDTWMKEIKEIIDKQEKHLEDTRNKREQCKKRKAIAEKNEKNSLAELWKALECLTRALRKYLDDLIANEALLMSHADLQTAEQSALDELNQVKTVSKQAIAASEACSGQALALKEQVCSDVKEAASRLKERALKLATPAMENAEMAKKLLLRAEDQKVKQIHVTEQELEACKRTLQEKIDANERSEFAKAKSQVKKKEDALEKQREELRQVQLDKVQAEARCNSFKRLEDADYTFNKMETVKKYAGDFDIFQEISVPITNGPASECTDLQNLPPSWKNFIMWPSRRITTV